MNINIAQETVAGRKRAKRGTTKCSHCGEPRLPYGAYCREHHVQYQRQWRMKERARIKALEAAVGVGWVEPA
jgi:hypothetical protein